MIKTVAFPTITLLTLIMCTLLCTSCGKSSGGEAGQAQARETPITTDDATEAVPAPATAKDQLYPWVDKVNIRSAPSQDGKVLASVQSGEALTFSGEKSAHMETIVLRGVAYEEPWFKVRTQDKTEGWIFGGTVKRQGETKGNDPISEQKFSFPYFGSFDLSTWESASSQQASGGDAETETEVYTQGSQTLEITRTDMGEYGYSRNYKLTDSGGKLVKARNFEFSADPEWVLTETVRDYSSSPPQQYTRSQKLQQHVMQLNEQPIMANGPWTKAETGMDHHE